MTAVSQPTAQARQVAYTIRSLIGVMPFMCLGASDLDHLTTADGHPALVFIARIFPEGQKAPRKMLVQVAATPSGTYDVSVTYKGPVTDEPVVHYQRSGVRPEQLSHVVLHLDNED